MSGWQPIETAPRSGVGLNELLAVIAATEER